jgi:hypothetical protein
MEVGMQNLQTIFVTIILGVVLASCETTIPAPIESATVVPSKIPTTPTSIMPTATYFLSPTPTEISETFPLQQTAAGRLIGMPLYSQDGNWLLVPTASRVFFMESSAYQALRSVAFTSDKHMDFATLSPDGKTLMLGSKLIALADGVELSFPTIPDITEYGTGWGAIKNGKFSPDSALLTVSYYGDKFDIWQMNNGKLLYSLQGQSLVFSPNSHLIAVKTYLNHNMHIQLYEAETGFILNDWIAERAVFLSDDQLVVETEGATRVYDLASGKVLHAFNGRYAAFSSNGNLIALLYFDRIEVRQVADSKLVVKIEGNFHNVDDFDMRFSPDGKTLLGYAYWAFCCAGWEHRLFLWRADTGSLIKETGNFTFYSFSPDGGSLALTTANGLEIWNTADGLVRVKLSEIAVP